MAGKLRRVDLTPPTLDLGVDDQSLRVSLRKVSGAKRFTLRVRSATRDVVLTMPPRASIASAKEFAERHVAWIGARMRRLPKPVRFENGAVIPLRGQPHLIVHRPAARGGVWTEALTQPHAAATSALCVAGGVEHVSRRVRDFLRREALRDLRASVAAHAGKLNVSIARVGVRDTTSRWGSCSSAGVLSFSWRLVFAPPHVLDYLAAHEVAHRVHLDHSSAFWALARALAPETDRAEAWLKAHGVGLHGYGVV